MEALKKKWNSRQGATVLLALLFLLVCMMAGTSILMAGASNAGKTRSNKEEQQKYLTLSSALNLMIDELESVEYVGQYTYGRSTQVVSVPVPDTEPPEYITYTYTTYTYKQGNGELRYRSDGTLKKNDWTDGGKLKDVLPLNDDLDYIFSDAIKDKYKSTVGYDRIDSTHYVSYSYVPKYSDTFKAQTYTLTLEVKNVGGIKEPVQIEVKLIEDGRIFLTATLTEQGGMEYTMYALLRPDPDQWPGQQFVLKNSRTTTVPIRWKLDHISKYQLEVTGG